MKKTFLLGLLIIAFVGGYFGLKIASSHKTETSPVKIPANDSERENQVETYPIKVNDIYSIPKKLSIPIINVEAQVESVGLDSKKAMDVPKGAMNAGWYNLGVKPGEVGNAVMAGHLDKADGSPAVFWNVARLKPGDKITVEDENGKSSSFSVTRVTKYPYDDFPLQEVFGPTDKRRLNLISCNGEWNSKTHNYSERTVVYSELIE